MRLIDADKLHYKRVLLNDCTQSAVVVFAKEIDKAEEVKAIPIEWIEKKLSEYVCSRKYSSDSLPVVYSLISDWRKENAGS